MLMLHRWRKYAHEAGFCEKHERPYFDNCDDCYEREQAAERLREKRRARMKERAAERYYLGVEIGNGARLY